jgi:hypothetical protein
VFISSARRPLALDVLSSVPVRHFGAIYAALNQKRLSAGLSPMAWGHLGDMADLSCQGELAALSQALATMAASGPLAGIALGNHEMSFAGSFHWSPHWDSACASGKLEKDEAAELLNASLPALPAGSGQLVQLPASLWYPRGGSASMVRSLGNVHHRGRERALIAIFLDTNDGRAFDRGMPGSVGSVSETQLDALNVVLQPLQSAALSSGADPVYVVLGHIPYAELAGASRDRVAAWLTELDARQEDLAAEPRVLAYVSAHRHAAGSERHCVGNRVLREITIGSTTDAPQQAAIVEVGAEESGQLVLSVRTVQSIARSGKTAEPALGIDAAACRRVAQELAHQPACQALLGNVPDAPPPRDCEQLEQPSSLSERLSGLTTYTGPRDPELRRRFQQLDAERLLGCVCRDGACQTSRDPLRGDSHWSSIEDAWGKPERRSELTCLAWAASACQAHKSSGMSLAEALRCSFDDPTLPAEQTLSAALESSTCN